MIKSHLEEVVIQESHVDQIICNCCGEPINKYQIFTNDYISFQKQWGYNSDYDNKKHKFDICQNCYQKIISNFKIPIEINDSTFS